jgi:hypothetical protein
MDNSIFVSTSNCSGSLFRQTTEDMRARRIKTVKPIAMLVRACALSGVILLATPSGSWAQSAGEALRNIEREMRDAPICQQMEG